MSLQNIHTHAPRSRKNLSLPSLPIVCLISLICMVCNPAQNAAADSLSQARYGLFLGANFNQHTASFGALPGIANCCPEFQSGSGLGLTGGLMYERPLYEDLSLSARLHIAGRGAELTREEALLIGIDGQGFDGVVEHSIDATFTVLALEPLVAYPLLSSLDVVAGFDLGFVMSASYEQKEELIEPSDRGVFENQTRVRNRSAGDVPDAAAILAGLNLGLRYDLPLDEAGQWVAAPELLYSYSLTPLVSGLDWNAHMLRLGVGIMYRPASPAAVIPPPRTPAAPEPPIAASPAPDIPPQLEASVMAKAIGPLGVLEDTLKVRIDEISTTVGQPLLPFVFFDEGSSTLPLRYERLEREETDKFSTDSLYRLPAMQRYLHVLNIIGQRLRERPGATIEIRGYNADRGPERNNKALSRGRAEAVREYLWDTWNIDPRRMKIGADNLPPDFSNPDQEDGQAENRRVEIIADEWQIMEPLILEEYDRAISPAGVQLQPTIAAEAGVDSYEIMLYDGDQIIERIGEVGSIRDSSVIDLPDSMFIREEAPRLRYEMAVADRAGQTMLTPARELPVERTVKRTQLFEGGVEVGLERYSLVVFPYDRATLNMSNLSMIEFIRERLKPESTVIVRGYSDRMGESDYNERLSYQRADAVAYALGVENATVQGIGESVLLHDNTLPEGRLYSRSVVVLVKSPKT